MSRAMLLALLVLGAACRAAGASSPLPPIPQRGETHHEHLSGASSTEESADVWVSYQISVVAVDGVPTDYAARERCLYYRVRLPAGERVLTLRLDYRAPTHRVVTTGGTDKVVQLEANRAYRLLDLAAGETRGRTFTPWLLQGAPRDELIALERPAR